MPWIILTIISLIWQLIQISVSLLLLPFTLPFTSHLSPLKSTCSSSFGLTGFRTFYGTHKNHHDLNNICSSGSSFRRTCPETLLEGSERFVKRKKTIPSSSVFSVTRRYRSDIGTDSLTHWLLALTWLMWPCWVMIPKEDFTDVSDDTSPTSPTSPTTPTSPTLYGHKKLLS